jgi:hypothetical protein
MRDTKPAPAVGAASTSPSSASAASGKTVGSGASAGSSANAAPSRIEQLYVTHCTYATAVLAAPGGKPQDPYGDHVRASSLPDEGTKRYYNVLQKLLAHGLEPPSDIQENRRQSLTARDVPARLAFYPNLAKCWILGHVSYRPKDSTGRVGCYFAHFLMALHKEGVASPSALSCLPLWGARGWRCEEGADIEKALPPVQTVEGLLLGDSPRLDEDLVQSFLTAESPHAFDAVRDLVPPRLDTGEAATRHMLVENLLHGFWDRAGADDRLLLLAEPGLAALLFFTVLRLVPAPLREGVGFSTYETELSSLVTTFTATTYDSLDRCRQTRVDAPEFRAAQFILNTYSSGASQHTPLRHGAGQYAPFVLDLLEREGWGAVDAFLRRLEETQVTQREAAERCVAIERAVRELLDPQGPAADSASLLADKAARAYAEAVLRDVVLHRDLEDALAQQLSESSHAMTLLDLLSAADARWPQNGDAKKAPSAPCRPAQSLLNALPETELVRMIDGQALPVHYRSHALRQFVSTHRNFPADLERDFYEDADGQPDWKPRKHVTELLPDLLPSLDGTALKNLCKLAQQQQRRFIEKLLAYGGSNRDARNAALNEAVKSEPLLCEIAQGQQAYTLLHLLSTTRADSPDTKLRMEACATRLKENLSPGNVDALVDLVAKDKLSADTAYDILLCWLAHHQQLSPRLANELYDYARVEGAPARRKLAEPFLNDFLVRQTQLYESANDEAAGVPALKLLYHAAPEPREEILGRLVQVCGKTPKANAEAVARLCAELFREKQPQSFAVERKFAGSRHGAPLVEYLARAAPPPSEFEAEPGPASPYAVARRLTQFLSQDDIVHIRQNENLPKEFRISALAAWIQTNEQLPGPLAPWFYGNTPSPPSPQIATWAAIVLSRVKPAVFVTLFERSLAATDGLYFLERLLAAHHLLTETAQIDDQRPWREAIGAILGRVPWERLPGYIDRLHSQLLALQVDAAIWERVKQLLAQITSPRGPLAWGTIFAVLNAVEPRLPPEEVELRTAVMRWKNVRMALLGLQCSADSNNSPTPARIEAARELARHCRALCEAAPTNSLESTFDRSRQFVRTLLDPVLRADDVARDVVRVNLALPDLEQLASLLMSKPLDAQNPATPVKLDDASGPRGSKNWFGFGKGRPREADAPAPAGGLALMFALGQPLPHPNTAAVTVVWRVGGVQHWRELRLEGEARSAPVATLVLDETNPIEDLHWRWKIETLYLAAPLYGPWTNLPTANTTWDQPKRWRIELYDSNGQAAGKPHFLNGMLAPPRDK